MRIKDIILNWQGHILFSIYLLMILFLFILNISYYHIPLNQKIILIQESGLYYIEGNYKGFCHYYFFTKNSEIKICIDKTQEQINLIKNCKPYDCPIKPNPVFKDIFYNVSRSIN